jgi:hypothetical protein
MRSPTRTTKTTIKSTTMVSRTRPPPVPAHSDETLTSLWRPSFEHAGPLAPG